MQSRAGGAHCFLLTGWYVQPALPAGEEPLLPQSPGFDGTKYVGQLFPEPEYQAGELSHFEGTAEHGFYENESEQQGSLPPPPPPPPYLPAAPELGLTSNSWLPYWDYPYYYDERLLRGQYPPGTYTYASANFEHGRDGWKDVHYLKESAPYQAEAVPQSGTLLASAESQPRKVPMVYTGQ